MKINGKITEIITSRAFVSFGGFVELEGKEFEDMKNIFTYLSKVYEFYCNHVVLKCICFNSVFYIGFNDNKICKRTCDIQAMRCAVISFRCKMQFNH